MVCALFCLSGFSSCWQKKKDKNVWFALSNTVQSCAPIDIVIKKEVTRVEVTPMKLKGAAAQVGHYIGISGPMATLTVFCC